MFIEKSLNKIFFNEKTVHFQSNDSLNQYKFGFYKDNAISYLIRENNIPLFKYVLERGANPLLCNRKQMNAVHFAVEL